MLARNKIIPLVTSFAGSLLVLLSTHQYGVGTTPDSAGYISAARQFAMDGRLMVWTGAPLTIWPPLYPVLLGFTQRLTGVDPLVTARFLNAFVCFALIWLSWTLQQRYLEPSRKAQLVCAFLLLFSPPLVTVGWMAWTELLFAFIVVGALYAMQSYWERHDFSALILMTICSAVAPLTRYVGVILLPVGIMMVLLAGGSRVTRFLHATSFASFSAAPLIAWMVRNQRLGTGPMGPRHGSSVPFTKNLWAMTSTILEWLPWGVPCLLVVGFVIIQRPRMKEANVLPNVFSWQLARKLFVPLLFVSGYLAMMLISASAVAHDPINTRLLSPVYVPLSIVVLVIGQRTIPIMQVQLGKLVTRRIVRASIGALAIYSAAYVGVSIANAYSGSIARFYNSHAWRNSSLLSHSRSVPDWDAVDVYSSHPDAIYLLTGKIAKDLPSRGSAAELRGTWPPKSGYLIWFRNGQRPGKIPPEELERYVHLELVTEQQDGALYKVSRADKPDEISTAR